MWGELDEDVLTTLVLTEDQIKTFDDLLFFQVLWLILYPSKSDIVNDPKVLYLTYVESFTNIYKFSTGQGGRHGYKWKNIVITEIV